MHKCQRENFSQAAGAANRRDERLLFVPFLPSLNLAGIRWSSTSKAACKTVPTQQLKVSGSFKRIREEKGNISARSAKHWSRGNELNRRQNLKVKNGGLVGGEIRSTGKSRNGTYYFSSS